MVEDDDKCDELYRIVNRAIVRCCNVDDTAANTEIALYRLRYNNRRSSLSVPQHLKEEREIFAASAFCDDLEVLRRALDAYAKENVSLSESVYRRLLSGINYYKPHIFSENLLFLEAVEKGVKRHLAEYKNDIILDDYNQKAVRIYKERCEYIKSRKKNPAASKTFEQSADIFFSEVLNDKELRQIPFCEQKLQLYINSLRIVDCLPLNKYNRTEKFRLKFNFNYAIKLSADALGAKYIQVSEKASREANRYQRAMECAKSFAGLPKKEKKPSPSARRKRAEDEWLYR